MTDNVIKIKSVLIVEDDKFLSNIHKARFAKEGYETRHATNGEEAIKMAREKKPDLILLDLIMPIKDGFETLQELKSDENLKDVKVVVLSNLGQEEDMKRAKELGALDYIIKADVSFREILAMAKKHLNSE